MADIKSMFAKISTKDGDGAGTNGAGEPAPKPKKKTAQTIEKIYQKKSQLEHILLRPDTYIGSVEKASEMMWIYDADSKKMVQKQIDYVPGLYKIFDEILVNAADNKQRDPKMDCIKVDINTETNTISVWNNGKGIPVVMHKDENMYVPTMIFGHLLTSSNYNDEEEKVTGGRNGYGAKLCNIFSLKFIVETASLEYKKQFKQTWGSNMTKTSEPKIKEHFGDDFTKITFTPDLEKFKMTELDGDIVGLISRRAFDVAASTRGVKVFLNGQRLHVKNFKDYIDLYIKDKEDECGNTLKICHEIASERWEVALTLSDHGFQQVSFVNSIATTKGGRHVDYVADMIVKKLLEVLKKKNKGGINIKPFQVKNHMWLFVNCLIVNPTFDSQTKENMTLQTKNFGSKCNLSDTFIKHVEKSGIVESVLSWAKFKAQNELARKGSGKKVSKLKGIPKLEDANEAGTRNALKCTLILTEGDSAKSLAVSGLGVIGRDYYGVFPLRGKLLNVREATHKQILENAEINNLIKILGLQYKVKYQSENDMKGLRYGKVMIMTDQDQDGSHIKGLLINFIHYNWPELLQQNFLEEFITPIVKAKKKKESLSFYSLPEFEEWKANTENAHTYYIKYYKGLGTSTSEEAAEYFANMARHRIKFRYDGNEDDEHILLAFSKKHVDHRKEWLTNFMVESRRRKEIGLSEKYLYAKNTKLISYKDFVNLELILFSNSDNIRSIPCLVDGLKPGQRKVLFTCIKRNDKKEVKVAQLSGSVAELSAYHHGETSLAMTIVNLAQNFVGSNNINILEPRGQFGTRYAGGKDSASPRYIFTKMSPLTRMIFHPNDDPLLKHEYDDNLKIEPVWYIPILPMVLVNGAEGIGTGWATKIPNYNPREIVELLRRLMDGEEIDDIVPWYKNFKGTIKACGDKRFLVSGEISNLGGNKMEITELPVGTWTQNYKENVLELLLHGTEKVKPMISDYKEYNTDKTVKMVIVTTPEQYTNIETEGIHKVFKLQTMLNTGVLNLFDEFGCLKGYDKVSDIIKEFYTLRLKMYQKRKDYMEGVLKAEAARLSNQARFILEKCSGEIKVENKKRKAIVEELLRKGYEPDPVLEWKRRMMAENDEEEQPGDAEEEEQANGMDAAALSDVKKFDYLLGMSMWMLTEERKNELLKQKENKLAELNLLKGRKITDLWREDLDKFLEMLDKVEAKEEVDNQTALNKKAPKKKIHQETMPSPMAQRIEPKIGEDIMKKIKIAVKSKETKNKKLKKENIANSVSEETDEFDDMLKSKKTLKDKLGTPEEAENKAKAKKNGGMKQTKLTFKKSAKTNGSPKKKGKKSDNDEASNAGSGSDVEFNSVVSPVTKERFLSRRNATKTLKYNFDSDEEERASEGEQELHDNDAVKEDFAPKKVMSDDSSSDDEEVKRPPAKLETSEDMFDSLIGKSKNSSQSDEEQESSEIITSNKKRKSNSGSSSPIVSDSDEKSKKVKKPAAKKPKTAVVAATKKTKPKKKTSDSESDFESKPKKKKRRKKFTDSASEDDSGSDYKAPSKGRAAKGAKSKYALTDDDDSD